ncbi:hypothetical protein [Nocardioides sp. zg-1228]|uniref:hypothetical protein n=1 Tax=Nocardioides sp. zg-1228 TaxID=2763008 RepID=UPI001642ED08|nr:hypothetical protein [Nocardioides sp. zg-1228]MBC2931809.1 hypothetical protein [Nocardioides sp. zg-1228]QSF57382.1 hypothetical protein JX575_17855 [Nocardioides sp. zg-1228]
MTRIVTDRVETQEDRFQFGDPIGCRYHWLDPDEVDSYGDSVRRLSAKVELAVDAFARTSTLSEDVFAGEAADTLRDRAARRHEESAGVRDDLRGLGRAINAYADVLRRHREGLEELRASAVSTGLEVREHRIWPPVATLPGDATQRQADAWEAEWRAYQACFETKLELRDARRAGARELVRALAEHAGVHPDQDRAKVVAAGHRGVTFGELRREAAEEAREAVDAADAADAARGTVDALRRREQSALESLERLVLAEAPHEEIDAQAGKVQALHRELDDARAEARDAEAAADSEQAQANRAARDLRAAEEGGPRLIAQRRPAGDLGDRLG